MKKILITLMFSVLLASCSNTNQTENIVADQTTKTSENFSLRYPKNYTQLGKEAEYFQGTCDSNTVENIAKIVPELDEFQENGATGNMITIGDTDYLKVTTTDAGMGHVYNTYYYSTILDNSDCFIIKLATSKINCENYLPIEEGNTQQEDKFNQCKNTNENADSIINELVNSFRFQ